VTASPWLGIQQPIMKTFDKPFHFFSATDFLSLFVYSRIFCQDSFLSLANPSCEAGVLPLCVSFPPAIAIPAD
jgi:hypothetical protein